VDKLQEAITGLEKITAQRSIVAQVLLVMHNGGEKGDRGKETGGVGEIKPMKAEIGFY